MIRRKGIKPAVVLYYEDLVDGDIERGLSCSYVSQVHLLTGTLILTFSEHNA